MFPVLPQPDTVAEEQQREWRTGTKSRSAGRISAQNRGLTRESYLAFLKCFVVNIVLRHFVSVSKRHSPGEITSLFLLHYSHAFIQSYRRKKHILPMLYTIAKLYYVCRRKQLIFNMMHIFNVTKSQSRKVIKIPSLFKLKVSNTCSAVHNKINKINFLRVQEFFFFSKLREKILTSYSVLKIWLFYLVWVFFKYSNLQYSKMVNLC